jgi:hypothetical protein
MKKTYKQNMQGQPLVITYENDPAHPGSCVFRDTLARNGWSVRVVGEGETWVGFLSKVRAYRAVCDTLPDEQLVIFSDSRDVLCLRPPHAFVDAFSYMVSANATPFEILCSAEIFCDSLHEVKDDYVGTKCVSLSRYYARNGIRPGLRPFVNSGLIAGTVRALRDMWQWILDKGYTDDQYGVGMYMNTFPEKVCLDSNADVFHTTTFGVLGGTYAIHTQKQDAPTYAELFGCGAFFIHIPGTNLPGQHYVYDCLVAHVRAHTSDSLLNLYKIPAPKWDAYGDLRKR